MVIPLRDWSTSATRAEAAMKRGTDALLLRNYNEAIQHFLEAEKHLAFIKFWISREGK